MKKILFFVILFSVLVQIVRAEDINVADFRLDEHDLTAVNPGTMVSDQNGDKCALLKIATTETGFTFDVGSLGVMKTVNKVGEIWVYVPYGVKWLVIGHPKLGRSEKYFFPVSIEKGRTYKMKITSKKIKIIYEEEVTSQYVVFQVTPSVAVVEIDGQLLATDNGVAQKYMKFGTYEYKVQAPNCYPEKGTVTVSDPVNKVYVNVSLKSNLSQLSVTVDNNAEIWVNGEKKGVGTWSSTVPAGTYRLEAKLASHISTSQTIVVGELDNKNINLQAPVPIYGKINVTSSPAMADITLDGKPAGQTPAMFGKVLIGNHDIVISKSGYGDYRSTVSVAEGQTANVNVRLSVATDVTLNFVPSNAKIMIDGATYNGAQTASLSYGSHTITMQAEGYKDFSTTINVTESSKSFSLTMETLFKTFTVKGVSFTMIPVQGSTFQMGATPEQEDLDSDEEPVHSVTLSSYYIGETEVTQELWEAVMGSNPSYFKGSSNPVERVTWNNCQTFIQKLNSLTGKTFRLPTEAEWEFAARGGNKSRGYQYSGSKKLKDVAWYDPNSSRKTHPVKTKQPNELGIYDMCGNVREWCQDWYGSYSSSSQTNPTGPSSGSNRVNRGSSWSGYAEYCRVANRISNPPGSTYDDLGLRLALSEL